MSRTPQEINVEILAGLDIAAEYAALGVRASGNPRASGMVSCYAFGRKDRRPSAWFNIKTGYYGDSGGKDTESFTCSLWDFAVRAGKFPDWKAARKAYAEKAGVTLGREKRVAEGQTDWREKLIFQCWTDPGNEVLGRGWCLRKPGITIESIMAAGGQMAHYPCYRDKKTKELKHTHSCRQVIAIPCYGQWFLDADPVAWQIFDCSGQPFDVTPRGTDSTKERTWAKDLSIGPTAGTLCGLSTLMLLCDPERREKVELVWWPEGPTCMLALWAAIPVDQRDKVAVIASPAGATADVHQHQAKILAGLSVVVIGDADDAGQVGVEKRCRALYSVAKDVRTAKLPYEVKPKNGEDVRDFLTQD